MCCIAVDTKSVTEKTTEGKEGEQAAKMRGQLAFAACGAGVFFFPF